MKDFLEIPEDRILFKDDYFFIIADSYAVSPGHLLIISNELRKDYFGLSDTEKAALTSAIDKAKSIIETKHKPDGYNIGMNCGEASGQTIFHFHCHVIPRYKGDMQNPRGGVRGVIPSKMSY